VPMRFGAKTRASRDLAGVFGLWPAAPAAEPVTKL